MRLTQSFYYSKLKYTQIINYNYLFVCKHTLNFKTYQINWIYHVLSETCAIRKSHLPAWETPKLMPMVGLGNRTYRPGKPLN